MHLAKKLGAAVAMAAVCCAMVVPTIASAACYHSYEVYETNQIILKDDHSCFVGVIENEDGSLEPL